MSTNQTTATATFADMIDIEISEYLVADLEAIRAEVRHPDYPMTADGISVVAGAVRKSFARQLMGARKFAAMRAQAVTYVTDGRA